MDEMLDIIYDHYPDKNFYVRTKVENIPEADDFMEEYELYIEDYVSETFETWADLEEFVYNLYKKEIVKDAEDIKNNLDKEPNNGKF
jgi:hypothetical protein